MTEPILIAFDGSAAARAATWVAAALFPHARAVVATARRSPATLTESAALARIGAPDDVIAGGMAALERAAADEATATAAEGARAAAAAGLEAEARVAGATGPPWRALATLAAEQPAAVVVCGSRGQGPFSRAALGSTSSALLHHLERPVLVVPAGGGAVAGPLVIGYDGSEGAAFAIERAAALLPGRAALVVHVWESPLHHSLSGRVLGSLPIEEIRTAAHDLDAYFRATALDRAEEGAALARRHGLDATAAEQEAAGAAWHGMLATGRAAGGAVRVVGSRGRGAVSGSLLGSVSSGLVHNADSPVLVIPAATAHRSKEEP